jgi:hypothetical protein
MEFAPGLSSNFLIPASTICQLNLKTLVTSFNWQICQYSSLGFLSLGHALLVGELEAFD